MPSSILYGVIAGVAQGFAAGAWVGFAWGAFFTVVVVGVVSSALAKNPRSRIDTQGRLVTIRQPVSPWEAVLGRVRKGGTLTFRYISPDRRFWHMVVTIACHPCEAVDEVFVEGERLSLNSAGFAVGKYSKAVSNVDVHRATVPGSPFQVTSPFTITAMQAVFIDAYGDGVEYQMQPVSGTPANFWQFSRSGSVFTFHSGAQGKNVVIASFNSLDDSYLRVKVSLGQEGPTEQPFPDLVAESNGAWTQEHRQYRHTKVYVRLEANPDLFPTGVPNVTFTLRGARDVYDPRTATSGYSANAALCTNWYLTNEEFGPGFDYAEEVDEPDLIAAANDADDEIALEAGGSEPRYETNGTFLTSENPKTVLERMLGACAGSLVDLGDKWRINMGVYHAPTVTLAEGDVAGPSVINPHLPAREGCNGVKGIFTDLQNHWQPNDFPAIEGAAYLAEDDGVRHWKTIDLTSFVTSVSQAQRVAKIDLLRTRQSMTEEGTFKLTAWAAVPGRTVARTDTQLGWSAKAFEVLDSEFSVAEGNEGQVLAVRATLRETAAAVYDWSTSEEQRGDLAPNTNLPDAGFISLPGQPMVTESIEETTGSRGVAVKVTIAWVASTYPFGTNYRPEYKLTSDSQWTVLPLTRATAVEIFDIAPGRYDFRVQALAMTLAASSEYSTTSGVEIKGLTSEPFDVTGFFVTVHEGRARCHLSLTADVDVQIGGRVWIRWSPLAVGANWNDGSLIKAEGYPGDSIVCEGPLYPGTYMAKFQDSTGHFSRTEASFVVTEALLTGFTTVDTVTFDPEFSGVRVNTAVVDGFLQLAGTTLWDDMVGNLDDQDKIDSLGGLHLSGSCTFSNVMDLGSVQTVRLFPHIRTLGFDTGDLWDSRMGLIDDWGLVDGGIIEDAEIQLQLRTTDDDPAGAPTWGPWHNLEVADYTARAFEFRSMHTSGDVTHNRRLEEFEVAAKQFT